jgi:adenylate cyclase
MTDERSHDDQIAPDEQLSATLRAMAAATPAATARTGAQALAARFAARLGSVAAHPERVPIRINGAALEARAGGTLLGAAIKDRVRLMHLCGARKLCSTCRVTVEAGQENLSPVTLKERLSLRGHLAFGAQTRLACQARVNGPVEVESIFPLCSSLPGE